MPSFMWICIKNVSADVYWALNMLFVKHDEWKKYYFCNSQVSQWSPPVK